MSYINGSWSMIPVKHLGTTERDVVKEIREFRNDLREMANAEIEEQLDYVSDSPYVKDRIHVIRNSFKDTSREQDWQRDVSYDEARHRVLVQQNLKRLNVI